MSLEEYKKKVEASLRKRYPDSTEEQIKEWMQLPNNVWQEYMKDFSPEVLPEAWSAGA